ncbi:1-deoxy-D-xylulose-5-phosphate synthase [bacterium]|nr:1-deoxy-D-xylulose-5-phosphate synthase [bacterium]
MTTLSSLLATSDGLPAGLRSLTDDQLQTVAEELRQDLIHSVSRSGGHFASSLGVAELTVALHATFNTPQDRLLWDVGHQGYIHKMVTGRSERMGSIRKKDGISGFLRRDESEYDAFGAGHAGTSISAAVGMALAFQRTYGSEEEGTQAPLPYVVPIIGDGSLTAGMAFEALNHAGTLNLKNFIVILNDNEMSISKNVGALSWFFSKTVTNQTSTAARRQFKEWHRQGYIPEFVYKALDRAEESAQSYFSEASTLFEAFGFRYIGPVDGHSMSELRTALSSAKRQEGPVVIHAKTVKGKGFDVAELDPLKWHAVKPFDPAGVTGVATKKGTTSSTVPTYTEVFSETLLDLCQRNSRIIGITAAMPTGTGLDLLQRELPSQYVDVGICEQHAVTFAAGLACEGYIPVCAIYSTFLQRGFDQVVHDVCIQNLPVIFALDRAGAVGNDGETHQGLFDISYLRSIPNITLLAPKDERELQEMLVATVALYQDGKGGPVAIRYPRGSGTGAKRYSPAEIAQVPPFAALRRAELLQRGQKLAFFTAGTTSAIATEVSSQLEKRFGFHPTHLNLRSVKPLDEEQVLAVAEHHDLLVSIEDHALMGGVGSALLELFSDHHLSTALLRFGAKDICTPHASQAEQYALHGYSADAVLQSVLPHVEESLERNPLPAQKKSA